MHINLARAYVQMNRPHEGMKVLQSIAAKPQSEAYVEAHLLSGRLYMAMPDGRKTYDAAEKHFEEVLKHEPRHAPALSALGKVYSIRDENYALWNEYLQKAVVIDETNEHVILDYGISWLYLHTPDKAREAFNTAGKLNPTLDRS